MTNKETDCSDDVDEPALEKALVLLDCHLGKCGDVVFLNHAALKSAQKDGFIDPNAIFSSEE